jgi:single-strand DNA-binding protein
MSIGNTVTIAGNLTDEPSLRFLESGAAVANFTVAVTERVLDRQSGEWRDGHTVFIRCTAWRAVGAENIAESLSKGARVLVTGKLRQHSYTTDGGDKRTVTEIDAEEVAVSLRFATAKPVKANRSTSTAQTTPADGWNLPAPANA